MTYRTRSEGPTLPATTGSKPSALARVLGELACLWGIVGILMLLGFAVIRLFDIARQALQEPLTAVQWVVLVVCVVFMAYAEGVRGFQRSWSPRVVARAVYLRHCWTPLRLILAPLFCMGFFHAPRKRMITAWCLTLGIIVLVALVGQLPQPWRGIVDAGVVVGLAWGMMSVVILFVTQLSGRHQGVDPEVPNAARSHARE